MDQKEFFASPRNSLWSAQASLRLVFGTAGCRGNLRQFTLLNQLTEHALERAQGAVDILGAMQT